MEREYRDAIIVGGVVLVAAMIVVWAMFFLRGWLTGREMHTYTAAYEQISMLQTGDNVTVAGVPVGRVESIGLRRREAVIHFSVRGDVPLTENTVAVIDASDMFGEAFVQLEIAPGDTVPPGGEVEGRLAPGMRDLIKESVRVVRQAELVITDARRLITRIDTLLGPGSTFNRTLDNAEEFTENINEFSTRFVRYGNLLERTMVSLDSAAVGIRGAVDQNKDEVTEVLALVESASARMDSLLAGIQDGQGTLGRLSRDAGLYEDLQATVREVRNLIREIREEPKRFIDLSPF